MRFREALETIPMVDTVVEPDGLGAIVHWDIEDEGTLVVGDEGSGTGGVVSMCLSYSWPAEVRRLTSVHQSIPRQSAKTELRDPGACTR